MNKIILVISLSILVSYSNKDLDNSQETKLKRLLVGSTVENINNSKFSVLKFETNKKLCFATINESFKNYQNKAAFPFSLWVTVETLEKNDNGHPTNAEATLYNNLEDALIEHFASKTPFCFIGRTTRDRYIEIMIYISDKDKATEAMNMFIKENKFKRKIEFAINQDPKWESVNGLYQ